MANKTQKVLFIVIPIILIFIIGTVLTVLYLTTDFLKSDKTLFLKYVSQNMNMVKAVLDNTSEKEYTNKLRQNKYESTVEISGVYTEKIDTSDENKNNDLNKLKIISENQSEFLNGYDYKNIKILYDDTNLLRAELIQNNDIYGFRFPEGFSQFLTVKNYDLKQFAKTTGLTDQQINYVPYKIENVDLNSIFTFTDEELATLQDRYLNILSQAISEDKYSRQKDAMITVNEKSYNTIAYSASLTQEQANNLYIKFLEQLKNDDIILNKISEFEPAALIFNFIKDSSQELNDEYLKQLYINKIEETINYIEQNNMGTSEVKYTVYVSNGNTIRTQILDETRTTTIDYDIDESGIEVNIKNKVATQEQENKNNIYIKKANTEEGDEFLIKIENVLGQKTSSIELYRNKNLSDSTAKINTGIKYGDGADNMLSLKMDEAVTFVEQLERKMELDERNNVLTNNFDESQVTEWMNLVKDFLKKKINENQQIITNVTSIDTVGKIFGIREVEPIVNENNEITQVDKDKMNTRYNFFTGTEKTYEDVTRLLDEVKGNLKGAAVSYSNEGTTEENKKLQKVILRIENGVKNEEVANELKEKLDKNKKYTVEVSKNSNDIVDTITISINK